MDLLPEDMEDYFGDIIQDEALLRATYVEDRYPSDENSPMNRNRPGEFPDNAVSEYDPRTGEWLRSPPNPVLHKEYGDRIKDRMELTLLTVLDRLVRTQKRVGVANRSADIPLNRMVFLQGGIGSGKTTMMHHFQTVVLPRLNEDRPYANCLFVPIVDFNNIDTEVSSANAKNEVLRTIRQAVERKAGLSSVQAWERIAEPDIYDASGSVIPAIATSTNPEAEKRRIVNQAKDHSIFLQRAVRHLSMGTRPGVVVIVYDNLDFQSVLRQLAFVRHLQHLLGKLPTAIGVVSVRERTLGHLCQLGAFKAFGHLRKMHMTTPVLPVLVQKRFDRLLAAWEPAKDTAPVIQVSERASFSAYDLREVFANVSTAFAPRRKSTKVSSRISDHIGRECVDTFLHNATNSNSRQALSLVVEAMQSWAFRYERIIREYIVNRDVDHQRKLPPFGVDELVRLAAVGQLRLYDHSQNEYIQNVFAWGSHMPNAAEGRFPLLLVYRFLQFFETHGDHSTKEQVYSDMRWVGYRQREIDEVLTWLIDSGFLESYEGPNLAQVTVLYKTRKTWFYFHFLSKMLVYLEHMRNDSVIEYEAQPHEFDANVVMDAHAVFEFIEYVLEQEQLEYAFVRRERKQHLKAYKGIVCDQPLSWKLLRSAVRRLNDLSEHMPAMFPMAERPSLLKHCGYMKAIILDKAEKDVIYPATCPGRNDVRIRFPIVVHKGPTRSC
jgi:hypothetical protein